MDLSVVALTQQRGVRQIGRAAVGPVHDVVGLRPRSGSIASGEGALAVTVPQQAPLPAREEPGHSAQVDHLTVRAEHDGDEVGVARELSHCGRSEHGLLRPGSHH